MSDLLYRGISQLQFESLAYKKVLEPKGDKFSLVLSFNGDFKFDGSIVFGECAQNAIAGHQKCSNKYKTSGISTTPHWHRALIYALNEFTRTVGYILTFEKSILIEKGISLYTVSEFIPSPEKPKDDEVILQSTDNKGISIDYVKIIEKVDRRMVWWKNKMVTTPLHFYPGINCPK